MSDEVKHTPGPWKRKDGSLIIFDSRKGEVADCSVRFVSVLAHRNERNANVCLIAAAPDLLVTLESVEWIQRRDGFGNQCPWCLAFEDEGGHADDCRRQMAIAKARGRDA